MPANPRVRANNAQGTITDNPLSSVATVMNSAGLANLPAISTQHAVLTLDPLRAAGAPEYVIVTAHTGSATTATITRGAYGSTARSHALGTLWVHAPLTEDFLAIVTASTRPGDPYKGQFIFETDTNKLVGYGGTDWAPRDAGGQLGYAQVTAIQSTITTEVDLTGLTTTVTVATGRRVRISGSALWDSGVAADYAACRIKEGTTVLQIGRAPLPNVSSQSSIFASIVLTPSAGVHTYKLSGARDLGTGNVRMVATTEAPAYILVEDIGAQ